MVAALDDVEAVIRAQWPAFAGMPVMRNGGRHG